MNSSSKWAESPHCATRHTPKSTRPTPTITTLAGGIGAARLLRGLHSLLDPSQLTVVVNTADDEEFHGLHVSPDVDTILYTLADIASRRHGWGVQGDSFSCLQALGRYYPDTWFQLGDRDLATHIFRSDLLRNGASLSEVTDRLRAALGIAVRVLPMSDDRVRTVIDIAGKGPQPFQQYLVRDHGSGTVTGIRQLGLRRAAAAPGVIAAIDAADLVILPPSNPFVSIGPILGLRGVRAALRRARTKAVAVSPIVGGASVKGPLDRMLRGLGHEVSACGVARLYRGLVGTFVIDRRDDAEAGRIRDLGMRVIIADTLMSSPARARRLAAIVVAASS